MTLCMGVGEAKQKGKWVHCAGVRAVVSDTGSPRSSDMRRDAPYRARSYDSLLRSDALAVLKSESVTLFLLNVKCAATKRLDVLLRKRLAMKGVYLLGVRVIVFVTFRIVIVTLAFGKHGVTLFLLTAPSVR